MLQSICISIPPLLTPTAAKASPQHAGPHCLPCHSQPNHNQTTTWAQWQGWQFPGCSSALAVFTEEVLTEGAERGLQGLLSLHRVTLANHTLSTGPGGRGPGISCWTGHRHIDPTLPSNPHPCPHLLPLGSWGAHPLAGCSVPLVAAALPLAKRDANLQPKPSGALTSMACPPSHRHGTGTEAD